jgi:uncharacterized repeat protein (TIGR01451 family)
MARQGFVQRTGGAARTIATLAALCCLTAVVAGTAYAADTPVSNFSKSGKDDTTGSTSTTAAGHTLDWVLSYRNKTGSQANVNITDPITGNQDYVPGSLKTPPGLDPQWSTDGGSSWVTSEPGSGVNGVGAKGTSVDGSTGPQDLFSAPLSSFSAGATQGDGWEALFIGANVWNIHHHTLQTAAGDTIVDCHVAATGAECPGYPATGQTVQTTPGTPLGTPSSPGSPAIITSLNTNGAVFNGRIYFPTGINGTTSIGVSCVDTTNNTSCGYTQLGSSTIANGLQSTAFAEISGGGQIGSKYYTVGASAGAPVFCFDMSADAPCAGWSNPSSVPGYTPNGSGSGYRSNLDTWGGYIFTDMGLAGAATNTHSLGCIVAATGALCPGFPKVDFSGVSGIDNHSMAPITDASGTVTGICASDQPTTAAATYKCYSVADGSPLGAQPWGQMVPGAMVGLQMIGDPLLLGTRLYLPYVTATGVTTYTCWDYATNAACAGFVPVSSGSTNVQAYTLRQDPFAPDCIWELGNAGTFEVFSATFGGSIGCNEGNGAVKVTPSAFYCDGNGGHVTGWNQLQLYGVNSSQYDAVAVTITDANGDPVPGWTNKVIPSNQVPIDISSIPYSGSTTTLNVQVVISWGNHPVIAGAAVAATFTGDAPQVCFQTKVGPALCATAHNLDNQANAVTDVAGGPSDAPDGNDSETVTLTEPADPDLCKWDLGVKKTALKTPYVPGSDEPFQIVVTNYGPDAARNVQVNDPLHAGLTFVSGAGCSQSGSSVICTISSLASGDSHTFNVTMHVPSTFTGTLTNPVNACSDKPDVGPDPTGCAPPPDCLSTGACPCPPAPTASDPHPNVDCVPVPPGKWDLGVTKKALKSPLVPGTNEPYQIVVTNYGPDTAIPVTIKDRLPSGLSFVSASSGCSAASGIVTCSLSDLAAGASHTFDLTAHVSTKVAHSVTNPVRACSDAPAATTACDPPAPCTSTTRCNGVDCSKAQVAARPRAVDPHANDACASVPIAPKLVLSKKVSRTVVRAGETLTYTIKTTNPSSLTLLNVKTCDKLPNGLAYVSSNPTAKPSHGQYCWTIKRLSAHKSKTYRVKVRALNGHSGRLVNPASATADNARRRTATRTVRVLGQSLGNPPLTG